MTPERPDQRDPSGVSQQIEDSLPGFLLSAARPEQGD
jgi:hypothetical protein